MAGLAFQEHHFEIGRHEINGGNTPWNTLAVWDVRILSMIGFLPVSDGLVDGVEAGVEEVVTISLLQHLRPNEARAILVRLKGVSDAWPTLWEDPGRAEWHRQKMASKVSRPATQMTALGLKYGTVEHLIE